VQTDALKEFNRFKEQLIAAKIKVQLFSQKPNQDTPDAVFPNNWFCQLPDGRVFIFPMHAANRRAEVRFDIIEKLNPAEVIDLRELESQNEFLEGTGSLIFDHRHRLAYAALSARTTRGALQRFTQLSGYKVIEFEAADSEGNEIYHTNVLMSVGPDLVVINLSAVKNNQHKNRLLKTFEETEKEILEISPIQMQNFAGNILYLENTEGESFWIGSARAWSSLNSSEQVSRLLKDAKKISADLTTIENYGGGGARCMLAETFPPSNEQL
jgi:hypothetical protein